MTPEEYLERERAADYRSEYFAGEMFERALCSFNHNYLATRLTIMLCTQTRDRDCEPLGSNIRLFVPATGLFTYPDLSVVCGNPELRDDDNLLNSKLIAEVLSPSTEAYDRAAANSSTTGPLNPSKNTCSSRRTASTSTSTSGSPRVAGCSPPPRHSKRKLSSRPSAVCFR